MVGEEKSEDQMCRLCGHAVDIVWGDVNPGNIVIDPELNVWVVDFGGGFIDGFVDKNLARTKEGDLDGIKGIFRQWIQSNDT